MSESPRPNRSELALEVARDRAFPEQPRRLSRRSRHVIVDADFFGDEHAVVWFVRRGHGGEPVDEFITLVRHDGEWSSPGGGGASPGADLEDRPSLASISEWNERMSYRPVCDFGYTGGGGSDFQGRPGYVRMQVAQEVAELRFSDRAPKQVAHHGYVLVMYRSKARPEISAFDNEGHCLGTYVPERWKPSLRDALQSWLTDWRGGFSWLNR